MTPTLTPARLVILLLVVVGLLTVAPFPAAAAGTIRIEAENYTRFSDLTTENQGNSSVYRAPGPDIFTCWSGEQACSNEHKVGNFLGGEWLEFDLAVPQSQRYALVLRYGTRSSGAVAEVLVDGRSLGGRTTLPSSGHYDTQISRTLGEVELATGRHTLRVVAHGPFTLDYLELQPVSASGAPAPTSPPPTATARSTSPPAADALALRIEAENYTRFSDLTTENQGDSPAYRAPGPDIFTCGGGEQACSNNHKVGNFLGSEWLEFDLTVPQRQRYAVVLRYGTRSSGAVAELLVDGRSLVGQTTLPSTGHYDTQASRTLGEVELAAGRHTLRVVAHGPFTLDYLELQPVSSSGGPAPTSQPLPTSSPAPAPSAAPPPVSRTSSARQWQPWEADLSSSRSYANPYADVVLRVTFQSPSGRRLSTFGFWDGGSTFTIRALFPEPGRWTWQTSADDTSNPGLHNVRGVVDVSPAAGGSNPLYARGALRVSSDGSHLAYADGTPFFWLGDTAWAGPLKATDADWEAYLDDRAAKGFTVIQVATAPDWAADRDTAGNRAWLGASGGQWNPAFWQAFERKVAAANRRGLVVLVVGVMEPDASSLPEGAARRFAQQLAGRLNGSHVLFSPSFDSPYEPLGDLVGRELAASTSLGLVTQHPGTPSGQATNTHAERYFAQSYLQFSSNQTGHNGGDRERIARQEIEWNLSLARRSPRKPVVNLEGYYDNAGGEAGADGASRGRAKDARAGAYRSWLSGSLGYSYGAVGIQDWVTTSGAANHWRTALSYASSRQMTVLRDLLTGLPWQTLRPAHDRLAAQPAAWAERAVFALSADRRLGLAYTPVARELRLDMTAFAAPVRATWVNPTTGQRTSASNPLAPSGVQRFTPPAGGDDWVLLLQP